MAKPNKRDQKGETPMAASAQTSEEESTGVAGFGGFVGVQVGFPVIDTGNYLAKFTGYKHGKSKAGEEKINCDFSLTEDNENEAVHSTKQFLTMPLSRKGLGITKGLLIDMGVDPSELEDPTAPINQGTVDNPYEGLDNKLGELVGTSYSIEVEKYVFEDKAQNRIKKVMMLEG